MREFMTTILDTLGLLLLTAGVVGGLWALVGPWALSMGGVVVIAGSLAASRVEASGDNS